MAQNKELAVVYIEAVAALAKALAVDVRDGRLWPGQASSALSEIQDKLNKASNALRTDR